MNRIDFSNTEHFTASEWPEGTLEHMNQRVFDALFELRSRVDCPMTPSNLARAHVRHEASFSRHSTNNMKRLADATDVFLGNPEMAHHVLVAARSIEGIGGIGIYFDTKPSVMLHIDMRPDKLDWVRSKGEYIYLQKEPDIYYRAMAREFGRLV